jgi:hypothetical protein
MKADGEDVDRDGLPLRSRERLTAPQIFMAVGLDRRPPRNAVAAANDPDRYESGRVDDDGACGKGVCLNG